LKKHIIGSDGRGYGRKVYHGDTEDTEVHGEKEHNMFPFVLSAFSAVKTFPSVALRVLRVSVVKFSILHHSSQPLTS
jgi:hypothetical protein